MNYFDELQQCVAQLGEPLQIEEVRIAYEVQVTPPWFEELGDGIEIDLNDLDLVNDHGGLLSYQGAQVLLFLQNQERHFSQIESGQFSLPKYHVADCQTLREMRSRNQFERYVVTNDKSGVFRLDGPAGRTMDAELSVCKNCLKHLNYRGYKTNSAARSQIFSTFNLEAFFAIYSSLFSVLPNSVDKDSFDTKRVITADKNGYAQCSNCSVDLPTSGDLLGEIVNEPHSDQIICLDCQRKVNVDTPQPVQRGKMVDIATARRKKRPLSVAMTWEEVYLYADSAYSGLLRMYQRQGWSTPEPGVDVLDERGAVCLQIGLAWFDEDGACGEAIVLDESEAATASALGWQAMTLNEALLDARQDE